MGGFKPPVHATFTLKPSPAPAPTWMEREREMGRKRERGQERTNFHSHSCYWFKMYTLQYYYIWRYGSAFYSVTLSSAEVYETAWQWQICVNCSQNQHHCCKSCMAAIEGKRLHLFSATQGSDYDSQIKDGWLLIQHPCPSILIFDTICQMAL